MQSPHRSERVETVVIGAGQAGLSVGYHLARGGHSFVILESHDRVGDQWRIRWDSLKLFTPAQYDGLVGLPFPALPNTFPTKNEMADYLEHYADHFGLPVRTGLRVERVSRHGRRYLVSTTQQEFEADHVVVAMGNYQVPRVPAFAREMTSGIVQLHSSEYRNTGQLREGPVLIVGAGNSGSEIAVELARSHRILMSGRDPGHVPFNIHKLSGRLMAPLVLRVLFHRIFTVRTPIGRRVRPRMIAQATPLIRVKPRDLKSAGVEHVPRVAGVRDGVPLLDDGRMLDVANVIWCTGFTPGFSWIDLPVFEADGEPKHEAGVAPGEPGLYFVGLHFLYAFSSGMIHGVARDAARIVHVIEERVNAARSIEAASKPLGRPGHAAAV